MSHKTRIMSSIKHSAEARAMTFTFITGTECPCMTSRQTGYPRYSEEWHRTNSEATDCEGIGLINTTTTTKNIKGFIYKVGISGNAGVPKEFASLIEIGEYQPGDLIFIGSLDTDNNIFISIDGHNDYDAYITYDSNEYLVRDVIDMNCYEIAHLVRKS